jgi:heterodisulfide reductase subunit C
MPDWGYIINTNNQIDLDFNDRELLQKLIESEPSVKLCIACGSCSGACSAGNFTQFSLRKIIALVSRGEIQDLSKELSKCMLCGKCTLVCPRGINTRNVIVNVRKFLNNIEIAF